MLRILTAAIIAFAGSLSGGALIEAGASIHQDTTGPPATIISSLNPSIVGQSVTFKVSYYECLAETGWEIYIDGHDMGQMMSPFPDQTFYTFTTAALTVGQRIITVEGYVSTAGVHCYGRLVQMVKPKPLPPPPPKPKPPPSPVASPSPSPTPEESPSPQPSPSPATAARTTPASPARRLTANFMPIDIAAVGVLVLVAVAFVSLWFRASRLRA